MAQCPVCQAEIKDDFGLVTCKSCGSAVLIDFDGQASSKPADGASADVGEMLPDTPAAEYEELNFSDAPIPSAPHESNDANESNSNFGISEPQTQTQTKTSANTVIATPDMTELESFGNSEQISVSAATGSLKFNLYISGLDSVDIREALLGYMDDSKFGWSAKELMGQIKNGELKLEALSPVKCAVLVQRLRAVPVEIRWEQYAIQQV